jgi:hypothetical protein
MISIFYQKNMKKCQECGNWNPENSTHDCEIIKREKFIKKEIFKGTCRNTIIILFLFSFGVSVFLLIQEKRLTKVQDQTIGICLQELNYIERTTATILDSQTELRAPRDWKPDQTFVGWVESMATNKKWGER